MKPGEKLFIATVTVFAGIFIAVSVWHALPTPDANMALSSGGQARELDAGRIERLIRDKHLSDHEALYYHPVLTIPEQE